MVNIVLNEENNTVEIPYSSAGDEQTISIKNIEDAAKIILAVKNLMLFSGEAICLEVKHTNGIYVTIERW